MIKLESSDELDTIDCIVDESYVMDWSKVDLPEVKPTRFQCGELSRLDHWKIVVVSKLLKKSNAAMVQTAVYTYLSQHWEEHEKRLIAEAAAQGITAEEMFQKLIKDDE